MVKRTRAQIGRASRRKGQTFERTISKMLSNRGFEARRAVQFDGLYDHDLRTDLPFNFECKAVEKLNIVTAMVQARQDAERKNTVPTVVHKKNNTPILITMDFTDFIDLLQWATGYVDDENTMSLEEARKKMIGKLNQETMSQELL